MVFCILKIGPLLTYLSPVFRRRSSTEPRTHQRNSDSSQVRPSARKLDLHIVPGHQVPLRDFFLSEEFCVANFHFLRGGPDPIWDWMLDWGLEYLPIRFTIHLGAIHVGNFTIFMEHLGIKKYTQLEAEKWWIFARDYLLLAKWNHISPTWQFFVTCLRWLSDLFKG